MSFPYSQEGCNLTGRACSHIMGQNLISAKEMQPFLNINEADLFLVSARLKHVFFVHDRAHV